MNYYDIRDQLTGSYVGMLFAAPADEVAIRSVRCSLKTGKGLPQIMLDSPEDYSLWLVGNYDQNTAVFESVVKSVKTFKEIQYGENESL